VEFPEVFSDSRCGFDAVIGNPPYEILSVKESGIQARKHDQFYYRHFYSVCSGKVNTYRLMIERGLQLLREGGALGFIVPATLLGDSTAEKLRRIILDRTTVFRTVVIPEKAKVFPGVTQALLVLVTRKYGTTDEIEPVFWNGIGSIDQSSEVSIPRTVLRSTGFRVPLIKYKKELELLEILSRFPPFGGNSEYPGVGLIHQGEINMTVHREFITSHKTAYPLVRGEHVDSLQVNHPSNGRDRLDWVLPGFFERPVLGDKPLASRASSPRINAWEQERIVLARVVNMDTQKRLKAALVKPGTFLGDMTNFIVQTNLPVAYLLGLLNSKILNRRIKMTSTNNYISAAELKALPIPRLERQLTPEDLEFVRKFFKELVNRPARSIQEFMPMISAISHYMEGEANEAAIGKMIEWVVARIQASADLRNSGHLLRLLDALTVVLFGAQSMLDLLTKE
jgi:Alw26I/Eco31I/Esp3I family type II restriction m6 adenine DNA methyltransferase